MVTEVPGLCVLRLRAPVWFDREIRKALFLNKSPCESGHTETLRKHTLTVQMSGVNAIKRGETFDYLSVYILITPQLQD